MKQYRIFDCTTINQTGDRFIFSFAWVANLYCDWLTMKTGRPHDFYATEQETTEYLNF